MDANYPDPSDFDEELYSRLHELPDGGRIDLEWVRSHVWRGADKFHVPRERVVRGMQANMFWIVAEDAEGREKRLVVGKRIVPRELPPKVGGVQVWKEFHMSVKREIDFYSELMEQGQGNKLVKAFPKVYYSAGRDVASDESIETEAFSLIVMEDVSDRFQQSCSMDRSRAMALMEALATLHSHYWGKVAHRERGSFWTMERRKPKKDMKDAESTWSALLSRLPQVREFVDDCDGLAARLAGLADRLDLFVEANAVTLIHGDCKAWNLFFGEERALFIDLQWVGRGHPMQDVAYSLTTSLESGLLDSIDEFVDFYFERLREKLSSLNLTPPPASFRSHFDVCWLDYARVVLFGLWRRLSHEQMKRFQNTVGPSMINKSLPHVEFIVKKVDSLTRGKERERLLRILDSVDEDDATQKM